MITFFRALAPVVCGIMLAASTVQGGDNSMQKAKDETQEHNPVVVIRTSMGDITVELYRDKAPVTVDNFLAYVKNRAYDGTIFHRVIDNFMIQGGGFTPSMHQITTMRPIRNEAANGLKNDRGTIAMARTNVVDSATSQFFINLKDNDFLNHRGNSPHEYGYAVFGRIIDGMDVVDKIAHTRTTTRGFYRDVPVKDVVIESVTIR